MIPGAQVLARRIRVEVSEVDRAISRAQRAWQAAQRGDAEQDMVVDSAALNLHGFYSGLERVFETLALQMDGTLPKGDTWHRDLLEQMTLDVPGIRPPVMSESKVQALDEYRRFRHVVRNVYAEHLDPQRIGDLARKLAPLTKISYRRANRATPWPVDWAQHAMKRLAGQPASLFIVTSLARDPQGLGVVRVAGADWLPAESTAMTWNVLETPGVP